MKYGYARVSTKGQAKNGNSLDSQEKMLYDSGVEKIFYESFTGTKKHRPELDKLMSIVKEGDVLVVTKLDRMARSARDGLEIIDKLSEKGVAIDILNMGKIDNSPTGKLMRTIFLGFAEFERDMIVQRTSEGKEIARTKEGFTEGRPKKEIHGFEKFLQKQKDGELSVNECCQQLEISRSTWYSRVREM